MVRPVTASNVETVSTVSGDDAPLRFLVVSPRQTFAVDVPPEGRLRIGRVPECEIVIDDESVSRVHAIVHVGPPMTIEDAGSRNGTIVVGTKLGEHESMPVPLGGAITIGRAVLMLDRTVDLRDRRPSETEALPPVIASPPMKKLFETVEMIAQAPLSALVLGETGVGKDVVARAIHDRSGRAKAPFVAINCAALPETILESELFGYVKGAFTGADRPKKGLFEAADGGTIFLDEVGELSMATQAKLLRVLETGEVMPLGSSQAKHVDVRVIAATNRDLRTLVAQAKFRGDLFFRLDGISVRVPPLRERPTDIRPLAEAFVTRTATRLGRTPPRIDPVFIATLEAHDWPGNVRELRSVIERAMTLAGSSLLLGTEHLVLKGALSAGPESQDPGLSGDERRERDRINAALRSTSGNQSEAAKLLGMSRRTLIRRLEQYDIGRPRKNS